MVNQLSSLIGELCSRKLEEEKDPRMKLDVDSLVKPEYHLSVKAEEAFVTKFNYLKKAAKEKNLQLQEVEDKLKGKLEGLKGTV